MTVPSLQSLLEVERGQGGRETMTSEEQIRAVLSLAVVMLWNPFSWFCRTSLKIVVGWMLGHLKAIALLRRSNPGFCGSLLGTEG